MEPEIQARMQISNKFKNRETRSPSANLVCTIKQNCVMLQSALQVGVQSTITYRIKAIMAPDFKEC